MSFPQKRESIVFAQGGGSCSCYKPHKHKPPHLQNSSQHPFRGGLLACFAPHSTSLGAVQTRRSLDTQDAHSHQPQVAQRRQHPLHRMRPHTKVPMITFLLWCISLSRLPSLLLVELGAAMRQASTIVPVLSIRPCWAEPLLIAASTWGASRVTNVAQDTTARTPAFHSFLSSLLVFVKKRRAPVSERKSPALSAINA